MTTLSFSNIYTKYYKVSFLFVKSYVHDDMAAEDIVSESLISLWQASKKDTIENPKALLLVILKNNALNFLKNQTIRQTAEKELSSKMAHDLEYRISTLEACEPESILSSEIADIVEETLLSLPEQTRRIFEMSRYESMSTKEIADALQISIKGVEYHITKALKALRISLKDYLPFFYLFLGM